MFQLTTHTPLYLYSSIPGAFNTMTLPVVRLCLGVQPRPFPEDFKNKPDINDVFDSMAIMGMTPHDKNEEFPSLVGGEPGWLCCYPGQVGNLDWSLIPFGMLMTHVGDSENDDNFHCVAVRFVDGKYFIICGALGAKILKASPEAFHWCLNDNRGQEHLRSFLNIPFVEDRVE